jgi:hypothetical protein
LWPFSGRPPLSANQRAVFVLRCCT